MKYGAQRKIFSCKVFAREILQLYNYRELLQHIVHIWEPKNDKIFDLLSPVSNPISYCTNLEEFFKFPSQKDRLVVSSEELERITMYDDRNLFFKRLLNVQ